MSKARHEAGTDRIPGSVEHDRHAIRCTHCCLCRRSTVRNQNVHRDIDQLMCEQLETIHSPRSVARLKDQIVALDPIQLGQSLSDPHENV